MIGSIEKLVKRREQPAALIPLADLREVDTDESTQKVVVAVARNVLEVVGQSRGSEQKKVRGLLRVTETVSTGPIRIGTDSAAQLYGHTIREYAGFRSRALGRPVGEPDSEATTYHIKLGLSETGQESDEIVEEVLFGVDPPVVTTDKTGNIVATPKSQVDSFMFYSNAIHRATGHELIAA